VGRQDVELDFGSTMFGRVGVLGERELALTRDEAQELLRRNGDVQVDPDVAIAATGGWLTGVLFEAWRAQPGRASSVGESDPLYGYLASEVLARLDEADTRFLVITSVLDRV